MAELFSKDNSKKLAMEYLQTQGILSVIQKIQSKSIGRIEPDYCDLARLHSIARFRKCFTILEFGIGYSTIVLADAVLKNQQEWVKLPEKPAIRCSTQFQIHTVDTEEKWTSSTLKEMPEKYISQVKVYVSPVSPGNFNGIDCHFYNRLPDVVPDLIYLDGPDPRSILKNSNQFERAGQPIMREETKWENADKVVLAADILRMESWLLPGTAVIVDGRTANVRFLKAHLYRNWKVSRNEIADVTIFELQEAPLGKYDAAAKLHCLGSRVSSWGEY